MPDFTFPELNSDQGTQTADTLRNAANAAAEAVCNLYENYPSGVIPSFGDPTGVGAFTDGLLNRLCAPRGKVPTPPAKPFNGGQCACVNYSVKATTTGFGLPDLNLELVRPGPISGIRKQKNPNGNDTAYGFDFGSDGCQSGFAAFISSQLDGTVTITSVTRVDALPDTCGDPPVQYPVVTIPPNVFAPNITVGLPGGAVSIPVTIIPTLIRPELEFRPEFNIDVGGINANINLGGIDLSIDPTFDTPITLPPGDSRPSPPTPTTSKEPRPAQCNLDEVIKLLEDIKECACGEEKELKSLSYPPARGRSILLPPDTQYVVISAIAGDGVKFQVAEGNAPDVYYLGWFSFGNGAGAGEKLALNFLQCGIKAPEGATSFTCSLNFGSVASLTVYYLEELP